MSLSVFLDMDFLSLFAIVITLVLLKYTNIAIKSKIQKKLPPGKMGFLWIGETIDFLKAQKKNKLYEDFLQPRFQKNGKMFRTRLMGSPTIVVSGAEANKFFMTNEFKLVISSWPSSSVQLMGTNTIMEKQGESHRFLRGLVATTLVSCGLENLVPKICKTIEVHLKREWEGREKTISLYRETKVLTFKIVMECLFGIEVKEGMLDKFEKVLEGVFGFPINFPGSKFYRAKCARKEIENMLVDIVRRKRKEMEDGKLEGGILLIRLIEAMIGGEISELEVVDNVVLLVFAAHDTTSFAIAMMLRMLAHHPHCYSLLLKEHAEIRSRKGEDEILTYEDTRKMTYTWQVAKESLRIFPPIFGSFRKAVEDIQFQGFTIPKGWKVHI